MSSVDLLPAVDCVERAKSVASVADRFADEGDRQGRLSPPVVDALHAERLFGMWVPKTVGGSELDVLSSIRVIETLSYGDPSTGWVLMAAALAIGTGAAYLDRAAVDELFGGQRFPVIAGQGTRPGTAIPVARGFRLSGLWSFASGIKHATHIHTLGLIQGTNEPRIFVLPVDKATLLENWDVLGLRATGSIDYRIDDVFVPDEYTHFAVTEQPKQGGDLYRIGIIGFAAICHSAWACGIGRRLLDELAAKVRGGIGRSGTLASSDAFHEQYAKAEAAYRAARALVFESWSSVKDALDRGERLTTRHNTMIRLAMAHITWTCKDVADLAYKSAGTIALRAGTLQRLYRDMHAGTQHITSSPPVFRAAGRELAGLADGKRWMFLDLVE
ncbi:MAG TPA: acyl-CoA dehydrogenase family protein [Vicinamibacterales bacterium]|nr:acyl-CoA dehydrogenase family protein [Vicinamibacterales bacterium]